MNPIHRTLVALAIILGGLALAVQVPLLAGNVSWQRFADAYEDIVVVTRAEWRDDDNELRVRATTTAGGDTQLTVFETATGQQIGVMQHRGGNEHEGRFTWPRNPRVITVRSRLGGEATVLVSGDDPPTVTPGAITPPRPTPSSTPLPPTAPPTVAPPSPTPTVVTPGPSASPPPTGTAFPWTDRIFLPRNLDE